MPALVDLNNPFDAAAVSLLFAAAIIAAWQDLSYRRLPNWLSVAVALGGLLMSALAGHGLGLASAVSHMVLALAGGMVLFRFGWIGGGDAKYYAACAAWFSLGQAFLLLLAVSLSGLVVVLGWFGARQFSGARLKQTGAAAAAVPYGVAIGIGSVIARAVS